MTEVIRCGSGKYIVNVQRQNLLTTSSRSIFPYSSQKPIKNFFKCRTKIRISPDRLSSVPLLFSFLILLFSPNLNGLSYLIAVLWCFPFTLCFHIYMGGNMNVVKYVLKFKLHIKDKIRTILQILCTA